ncbi:MAG: SRPBCC family protein [Bacteroidota bacterium]
MRTHSLKNVQKIPISLEKAWDFFSYADNLEIITPTDIDFKILTELKRVRVFEGQVIEYKIKLFPGLSFLWRTEITQVEEQKCFTDIQLKGPYKMWRHEHYFKSIDGGMEMTDMIHYKNPLGILGYLANWLFVKRKLKKIFEFRFKKVEELFGKWPSGQEYFGVIN